MTVMPIRTRADIELEIYGRVLTPEAVGLPPGTLDIPTYLVPRDPDYGR